MEDSDVNLPLTLLNNFNKVVGSIFNEVDNEIIVLTSGALDSEETVKLDHLMKDVAPHWQYKTENINPTVVFGQ